MLGAPASFIGSESPQLSLYWAPALRFAPPQCSRDCLMYTGSTSLPNLYIRNIIPGNTGVPLLERLALYESFL